jgi:hypothetical protein
MIFLKNNIDLFNKILVLEIARRAFRDRVPIPIAIGIGIGREKDY